MLWCAAQLFVTPYSLWVNGRALGTGPLRPLRAGLPMFFTMAAGAALAITLNADGPFVTLLCRSAIFATVMAAAGVVFWPFGGRLAPKSWMAPGTSPVTASKIRHGPACPGHLQHRAATGGPDQPHIG